MKNIEQILKDAGLEITEEQKESITKAVAENYKTIAEFEKQVKKTEKAEGERDALQKQYDDAQETIKGFDGVDVEKLNKDIASWKERAEKAEKEAAAKILQRDQRDYLKGEFDKLEIKSERIRSSLMADIMGEDGLKWKGGAFMGLSDYLAKENEKEHFYQTQEEKDAAAAQEQAEQQRVREAKPFTQPAQNQPPQKGDSAPDVPVIF